MGDALSQWWHEIVARPDGPLAMRFYLQPLMACLFAIRDGHKDAQLGKPPYFWALFTDPAHRRELLQDGWRSVGKIAIIAVVLDTVYQIIVLKAFHPLQALLIAALLAIVPYLLVRGPVNRLLRGRRHRRPAAHHAR